MCIWNTGGQIQGDSQTATQEMTTGKQEKELGKSLCPAKSSFISSNFSEIEKNKCFPPLTPLQQWCLTDHYHWSGWNHFLYMLPFIFRAEKIRTDTPRFWDNTKKNTVAVCSCTSAKLIIFFPHFPFSPSSGVDLNRHAAKRTEAVLYR